MNIITALDDPTLFRDHFRGDTWKAWKAFLATLFALPMDDDALATYTRHTGRQEPPTEAFREAALVIGRRGGKSRVLALVATFLACFHDYTPYLAPGEIATIAVIAADRRQARSIFRFITGLLNAVPMLAGMIEDETAEQITLSNRVAIEITTASFRVTRGYTFAAVLADEVAFWRSDDSANPDQEIIAAIRPGLSTIPSSMLLLASSPYRRRGVLYSSFTKHYGQERSRVLVWKADTLSMNPGLDPRIAEEAYEDDPEAADSEYGGNFRSDISDFIPRDIIKACTATGVYELAPIRGVLYYAFVDPSGGSADSMTLAVTHRDGERIILDAVREAKPPFSPESVVMDFVALLKSYGISRVTGDRYAGEWPRERFRTHGIQYDLAEMPKSEIYLACVPLLNATRAQLLDLARLASQLCGLERRTSRSGRDTVDHAPGTHDDLANAVAGALVLSGQNKSRPAIVSPLRL
jgi:hypothetical protein